MRKWLQPAAGMALALGIGLCAFGCGDDDKGSGPAQLSEEEQFEIIQQYFSFDPENQTGAVDIASYVLGLMAGQYWDGIDTSDVVTLGKRALPPAKAGATSVDVESLYVDYNFVSGWWEIYYSISSTDAQSAFQVIARDSIRFKDGQGNPQIDPDPVTTMSVEMAMQLTSSLSGTAAPLSAGAGDYLSLSAQTATRLAVNKVDALTAQVDGAADVGFLLQAASGDTAEAEIDFDFTADYDEVVVPLTEFRGELCPTSGEVSAGLNVALDVRQGENEAEAEGSWDASITFTGGGNATLHVESGDFSEDFSGQVCYPPD
ncbi:MAG TPA: hypothetical protein VNN55_06320 [bacterium]|nr:hypothetical protein [bacterium]